ncbi:MAG TPA: cyclic nucleotide-binding domain-containing protein [Planctomycetota bacterium]|nr:cyclic nucleotide-binding domain-containing protein [Planctomycetota bacterium]
MTPLETLERTIPFAFLDASRRAWAASRMVTRSVEAGDKIVLDADRLSASLFIITRGSVELADGAHGRQTVAEGQAWGELTSLLGVPHAPAHAGESGADLLVLAGQDFLALVDESAVFSQALATILVKKLKVFDPYRALHAKIVELTRRGSFFLSELLPFYRQLHPALHPQMDAPELDVDALRYAVLRLPPEVTRTTFYFLTDTLPVLYSDPDTKFLPVSPGKARRRAMWQLMAGKLLVLVRDGLADVTDLLTCLCLYAHEVKKLRMRIGDDKRLRQLAALAERDDPEGERWFLDDLPLSPAERQGIERIWPRRTAERLRDVLLHHEDVAFDVRSSVGEYSSRASDDWVAQIRAEARKIVDLDGELAVHVISSNTHSVGNCLSPYMARHTDEILAWGRERVPELAGESSTERPWGKSWSRRADLVYATAARFLAANPDADAQRIREERSGGRVHVARSAFTGIEVDLFDARALDDAASDPDVTVKIPRVPTLVVNVDYAFGEQADEILAALVFLFGRRIRSVNVLGKAGALVGHRGDLLLPRATLLQTNDELYRLPNHDLDRRDLLDLADGRGVHDGTLLTVSGTLLQDRKLLLLYRRVWRCIGLEMEGSFFARRVHSAIETGLLAPDVKTRFAYYVSDVPLEPSSTLAESLRPDEGVPPLYAITRAVLRRILATS